jgi:hypothetical protein
MADEEKQGLWGNIQIALGYCPANLDKHSLVAAIKDAQGKIGYVLLGGDVLQGFQKNGGSIEKLTEMNNKLGEVLEKLDKIDEICKDIIAMQKIHYALTAVTTEDFRNDPMKAAKAFDGFFNGLSRICRLTPILKPYQDFFERFNLFEPFARLRLRKESEVYIDKRGGRFYAGD